MVEYQKNNLVKATEKIINLRNHMLSRILVVHFMKKKVAGKDILIISWKSQ